MGGGLSTHMLKHVRFQGVKALLDVQVDLDPLTVIVGPNGCGKSTLLDQIDLLCQCSQPTTDPHLPLGQAGRLLRRTEPSALVTHEHAGGVSWEGVDSADHHLRVSVPKPRSINWDDECRVEATDKTGTSTLQLEASSSETAAANETLAASFAWRAQRLRLIPSKIAAPVDARQTALDHTGLGLAAVLAALALNDQDAYATIQRDLRSIVPQFEKLQLSRPDVEDDKGVTHGGVALGMVMKGAGLLPASAISEGTLLALALLTAVHDRDLAPVILMDDLDHGLHLGGQVRLVKAIRDVIHTVPGVQVICTSHSPYLLQEVPAEAVRVMALDPEGRAHLRPLVEHPEYAKWAQVMNTGELWANLGEEWVVHGG